jgi:Zn-dependent metalloprotease
MRPNLPRHGYLLCSLLVLSIISSAQESQKIDQARKKILADPKVASVQFSEKRQTASFILLKDKEASYTKNQTASVLRDYLNLRPQVDNLVPAKNTKLRLGFEVLAFQQYYKGIKVEHADFKSLVQNGRLLFFNGCYYDVPLSISTTAKISDAEALGFAKAMIKAKTYAWEELQGMINKEKNVATKKALQDQMKEYLPKGELVIVRDFTKKEITLRLAYKFNIYATEPLSRGWVYVDAENGKILLYDSILKDFNDKSDQPPTSVSATVQTRYAGIQIIKTKQISGNDPNSGQTLTSSHPTTGSDVGYIPGSSTWVLMDDTRGDGIETYDLNGIGGLPISVGPIYAQGKSFTDVDNNWTFAEHHRSPANDGAFEMENDDIAWDAHWGAEVVYDYWLAKHNRLSFDGNNGKIKSFIHYGPAYDNAFWNGTVMTYGDGSGPTALGFKALTSLDVCGHEIGHGVCSSTSDLVYQSESGAMNEGLSDIWAACIEYFAMTRSGSTVPANIYRPFYIGEQFGSDYNHPLRRMDNVKQQGNPDTYGGTNWVDPACAPNLANDECGVHTNSGVLNKWFFLITAGSINGTRGPGTSAYYFPDSDDEINDLGNTYRVNGLGFDVSENIVFITETLLSSDADYAQARNVSISVANALSGDPCSAMAETVTNAWYAVGVGNTFVTPCKPVYGFVFQPGTTVSETTPSSGCAAQKSFFVPVLLPPGSTATITTSGTATSGQDYNLSSTSLSNASTTTKQDTISVFIKNDAVVESDETIVLNVAVTNTGTNPVNTKFTITITDDDVTPVIGTDSITLLNDNFTGADGFTDPTGWTEKMVVAEQNFDPINNPIPNGKNQWGRFNNQLAVSAKDLLTGLQVGGGTYNINCVSNTIIHTNSLIDARGLNTLRIRFDYLVGGERDPNGTDPEAWGIFDFMAITYSYDGSNYFDLPASAYVFSNYPNPNTGTYDAILPSFLNNKQFYLGFRWSNDPLVGNSVSVTIDNLVLKGLARKIENDLNDNARENVGPGQEVYFYSVQDGQIVGRIKNNSTKDFGCTNVFVERAGNGAFNLYQSKNGNLFKVADKIIRVEPGSVYKASTSVTLYYTEQQLHALELATNKSRTAFHIYHVNAASYSQASTNNTDDLVPVYTAIPNVGGYYTVTFNEKAIGSYALGAQVSIVGLQTTTSLLNETNSTGWKFSNLYPNPSHQDIQMILTSPKQNRINIEIMNVNGQIVFRRSENLQPGTSTLKLNVANLSSGIYMMRLKDAEGKLLNIQSINKQ